MILKLCIFAEVILVWTLAETDLHSQLPEIKLRRSKRQSHPQYEYRGSSGSHGATESSGRSTSHAAGGSRAGAGSYRSTGSRGGTGSSSARITIAGSQSPDRHGYDSQYSQRRHGTSRGNPIRNNERTGSRRTSSQPIETGADPSYVGYYIDSDTRGQTGRLRTTYGTGSYGANSGSRYRVVGSQGHGRRDRGYEPSGSVAGHRQQSSGSRNRRITGTGGARDPNIPSLSIPTYSGARRTEFSGHGSQYIPTNSRVSNANYNAHNRGRGEGQRRTSSRYGDRCPGTGISITVNGLTCPDAVRQWPFVCYYHQNTSMECCENCLDRRVASNYGCEYGDRSFQCRNIETFECYSARNEDICCDTCKNALRRDMPNPCRYGDRSHNCERARQNSGLCYQQLYSERCCETCPSLQDRRNPGCEWGDHFPEFCEPFDDQNRLSLDCYNAHVSRLCCATCARLQRRMRVRDPSCQYGDRPVRFQIPETGASLDCHQLMQRTNGRACSRPEVRTNCCSTCRR